MDSNRFLIVLLFTLHSVIICTESVHINDTSFEWETEITTAATTDAKTITERKCDEYAAARFRNITTPGVLEGDDSIVIRELDCVQEYAQKAGVYAAKEKEYPHLALLGSGQKLQDVDWSLTGSLISERFILSVASSGKKIKWAALGLLKRASVTADKLNKNIFEIVETFIHAEYKAPSVYNDIALYKLESALTFTPSLRPVCLYTSDELSSTVQNQASVTGWGQIDADETENGGVLRKGKIDFIDPSQCLKRYANYANDSNLKRGFDAKSMICAGNLIEEDITCVAQNGGSLQVPIPFQPCMWWQIGITSYGSSRCADDIPTTYTKVSNYLVWIQSIVWPL